MNAMAAMAFLTKIPEWQWYYDPALNSLLLTVTSSVRLYIFFQHGFYYFCLESAFDPMAPSDGTLLYEAHPVTVTH